MWWLARHRRLFRQAYHEDARIADLACRDTTSRESPHTNITIMVECIRRNREEVHAECTSWPLGAVVIGEIN